MQKIGVYVLALVLGSWPVFAQDQGPGEGQRPPSAAEIMAQLESKLNLTQDQVNAIEPVIEKYAAKRQELRQSMDEGTADHDNIRGQMRRLRSDENKELGQFLSSDQMFQMGQMMDMRRHKGDGPGAGEGDGIGGGD